MMKFGYLDVGQLYFRRRIRSAVHVANKIYKMDHEPDEGEKRNLSDILSGLVGDGLKVIPK